MPPPFLKRKLSYHTLIYLYFLLFGIAIALLSALIHYGHKESQIKAEIKIHAEDTFERKQEKIDQFISRSTLHLSSLLENRLFRNYVVSGSEESRDLLEEAFLLLVKSEPDIMQLRLINRSGLETVRVERSMQGETFLTPRDKLQNKSSRYYFAEAMRLDEGEFWYSPIDLNMENHRIEKPYRPTIRVATPIGNRNNRAGILILNLAADHLGKRLIPSADFEICVIDGDGNYIFHPDPDRSFSRYLNRPGFLSDHPDFKSLPKMETIAYANGFYFYPLHRLIPSTDHPILVFKPRQELIDQYRKNILLNTLILAISIILVAIPLANWISIYPNRLQSKLEESTRRLKTTADILDRYVIHSRTDENGKITGVSTAFCECTGYTQDEMIGKYHSILKHPDTPAEVHRELWNTIKAGKTWKGELKNRKKNGEEFWVELAITPVIEGEAIKEYTTVYVDITMRKMLEIISITDPLTEAYNRNKLMADLLKEHNRAGRSGQKFSILLLDVDHFKKINDHFGHHTGDTVLIELVALLKENTRTIDTVGRWGGEEFLILLPETDANGAAVLAEKIRSVIEHHPFQDAGSVTISIGIADCIGKKDIDMLIIQADRALYRAKGNGRNRVEV